MARPSITRVWLARLAWMAVPAVLLSAAAAPAHAYVDPSSGSILLQVLLGGFAGVLVALKLSWRRLASWFGRRPAEPPLSDPPR